MGRGELGVGERERASQLHAHGCYIKDYIYTAITNPATSHVHMYMAPTLLLIILYIRQNN